jgi:hypothetical protein
LVVQPQHGQPLSLLEYRAKPELEWLATTLRGVLELPNIEKPESPDSTDATADQPRSG